MIAVIGTVEEISVSLRALTLARQQFETNVFGPMNIMKASLPTMREKKSGHIITVTGRSMVPIKRIASGRRLTDV
jgi:short-subunit dehydrogenase